MDDRERDNRIEWIEVALGEMANKACGSGEFEAEQAQTPGLLHFAQKHRARQRPAPKPQPGRDRWAVITSYGGTD
jgi:hypothetical protein